VGKAKRAHRGIVRALSEGTADEAPRHHRDSVAAFAHPTDLKML
jgi:hypothetical protein